MRTQKKGAGIASNNLAPTSKGINTGSIYNRKNTQSYQSTQSQIPFKYSKTKILCPCGEHSSFVPLVSHDSGGKCWSCQTFFPPNSPAKVRQEVQPTLSKTSEIKPPVKPITTFEREHIYWNNAGDNYLMKVTVYRDSNGKKSCYQSHWKGELVWQPDGSVQPVGEWINGLLGVKTTLYDSPLLLMMQDMEQVEKDKYTIFVVEGEKDCETLKARGFLATCNPMGAGKWVPEYNEFLRGLTCVVIPDNDEAGHKHADLVVSNLQGIAKKVIKQDLKEVMPELLHKGDVTDYFMLGGKL